MLNITATMVAELRQLTGLGMMECKKALVEASGDSNKAQEILRIKSGVKANKIANRAAAEGVVVVHISEDGKSGSLIEVNCETDFVAKDENFLNFAHDVARLIVKHSTKSLEELLNIKSSDHRTIAEHCQTIVAKLGENISVRRFELFSTTGKLAYYLHGKKIGVLIALHTDDQFLGRDLAMHIAANKPLCVSKDGVPTAKLETEKNIYTQQALATGKSPEIVSKMVEGRIAKYLAEVTLLGQAFVKNPEISVEKLLQTKNSKVENFVIYTVGEGIEKTELDFATEVATMTNFTK